MTRFWSLARPASNPNSEGLRVQGKVESVGAMTNQSHFLLVTPQTRRVEQAERSAARRNKRRLVALLCFLALGHALAARGDEGNTNRNPEALEATGPELSPARHSAPINAAQVNGDFLQSGGSCVLSSYAIAASYFTGHPIATYFEGYCQHFGLTYTNALDAEAKYAEHFDQEWRKRDCRGYEVILDLHDHSKVKCFAEARKRFRGTFFLDSAAQVAQLEKMLTLGEAFLNITYEPGGDFHSITIFYDGHGLMARDTNRRGVYSLPGLTKIGKLRDSVLYMRN